jgi:hypothetical protein
LLRDQCRGADYSESDHRDSTHTASSNRILRREVRGARTASDAPREIDRVDRPFNHRLLDYGNDDAEEGDD